MTEREAPFRERASWCLFDFANSPYHTILLTAFGGPYFKNVLADGGIEILGFQLGPNAAWGATFSIAMTFVFLSSPLLGILADRSGKKKLFLTAYVVIGVAAIAALGLVRPGQAGLAFLLYIVASFAIEGAYVFYNAFLPELTTAAKVGRLSGYAWGLGYVGGLIALIAVRPLIPKEYTPESAGSAHYVYWIVAAWYLVFSLPGLLMLRDRTPRAVEVAEGVLSATWAHVKKIVSTLKVYRVVAIFLIAYFLYNDALTTVIEFVGIFTTGVLSFSGGETITLFLVLNLVAAPGAIGFGWLLDRIGGKRSIAITLVLWIVVVVGTALSQSKAHFWPVAVVAALVIGATQASSRALMARFAPRGRTGEFMGLLSLSGKASAVLGPSLYGLVADGLTPSLGEVGAQRAAICAVGSFFAMALVVLRFVDEKRGIAQANEASE